MSTFGISQQFTTSGVVGRLARTSDPVPEKVEDKVESEPESEYSDESDDDHKYDEDENEDNKDNKDNKDKPKKLKAEKVAKVKSEVESKPKEDTTIRTAHVMNYSTMSSRYEQRTADYM